MRFAFLAAAILLSLAGCIEEREAPGSGQPAGPMTHEVDIRGFAFEPKTLDVQVGDTVRWTNADSAAHTVSAEEYVFESGSLAGGTSFSFTFKAAGTFGYRCDIHPSMTGYVIVT